MTELSKVAPTYAVRDRSDYQLKHFVIGQHDTPEMRFRQIIIEARELLYKIKNAELGIEIQKQKIDKLESAGDSIKHLKAQQHRLSMAITELALQSAKAELNYLVELSKDYRHYTPDEIEANQPDYWEKRLTRQATTDRVALEQGVNAGNLASMMQAGLVQKELVN